MILSLQGADIAAAIDLLSKSECEIVDCCVLREVPILRKIAEEKVKMNYTVLLT